jgi:iodotyrosine deiodinase
MTTPQWLPLLSYREYPSEEMQERAAAFYAEMQKRRSVRHFSNRSVPREVIEHCLQVAASAPSGANLQPWHFVVVSDPAVKRQIRAAAEAREQAFYSKRASEEWLEALAPLGTGMHKPFLETAPYLIVIFVQRQSQLPNGRIIKHPYALESVGIATGMLITAIHHAGLASLTYTPSPMRFLNDILRRPRTERPFLVLVVGYPANDAVVPDIHHKPLREVVTLVEP